MVRTKHHIGRYRVIAPIGAGGFSTVYRALDEASGEEVAIKVLAENHSLVPQTRRRFVDEYSLLLAIDSPTIARIYEVGQTETGQPFMVLELANRGDLRRRVEEIRRSHQVLNRADLMMLANHLAEALGTLHQADIVHRDVSPGNILIRSRHNGGARRGSLERGDVTLLEPGERFLLADLGHAKDLVLASGFTAGGGTRGFAAPEQRDDVTVVDRRADIFSATAIIEWAAHDGRFADTLEPFFDVGLAAEPEERFDSMAQWHAELSNAIGTGNSSPSRSRFGRQRTSRPDPLAEVRAESRISPALEAAVEFAVGAEGRRQRTAPVIRAAKGLATVVLMAALATTALYALEAAPFNPVDDRLDDTSADADSPPVVTEPGGGRGLPASPTVDEETAQSALVVPGTDVEPGQHPWVALDQPMDGEVIDGDLVLSGTAEFERGIGHVELTLENLTNDTWWDGTSPSFGALRTTVDVEIEDTLLVNGLPVRGGFEVVVPEDVLQSGLHEIRLWARGLQNEGPAEPVVRVVVVP